MGTNDNDDGETTDGQATGGQSAEEQSTGWQFSGDRSSGDYSSGGHSTAGQSTGEQSTGAQSEGGRGSDGGHAPRPNGGTGLAPNVAGALCYALGWLTGILFLVAEDEDDFVRFHAAQSIVVFGGLTVAGIFLSIFVQWTAVFVSGTNVLQLINFLVMLAVLGGVLLWLGLMYVAYEGRWYELPIAGDLANGIITENSTTVERKPPQQR